MVAKCNMCNNYHAIGHTNWISLIPSVCPTCDEAPCIKACTNKAIHKQEDGTVIIDPTKCRGRRDCFNVCPNKALRKIYFKKGSNEAGEISYCGGCKVF